MEKDMIFFSDKGLTNTSANHIANICKEKYMQAEEALNKMQFYKTTISLIGSSEYTLIENGITDNELKEIIPMMENISQLKALIAWLREAIKARENLLKEVNNTTIQQYCEANNILIPKEPNMGHILTEEEYYGSLGIKERNAYYTLEAKCATLGQLIHPNGTFSKARKDMTEKSSVNHKVVGTGRDATIYTYDITVDPALVELKFFDLQFLHRETQAKLNSIKFECQQAIEKSKIEVTAAYREQTIKYNTEISKIGAQWKEWQVLKCKEIGDLKIIIPDNLKKVYDRINTLD